MPISIKIVVLVVKVLLNEIKTADLITANIDRYKFYIRFFKRNSILKDFLVCVKTFC